MKKSTSAWLNRFTISLFLALAICIIGLILLTEMDPANSTRLIIGRYKHTAFKNDMLMGWVVFAACLGLLAEYLLKKFRPGLLGENLKRVGAGSLLVLVVLSAFVYFYSGRALGRNHYPKFWDSYHYFLGSKYFAELGYNKLYECHLKADSEFAKPHFRDSERARDLNTYKFTTVGDLRRGADCSAFTPSRWKEFKRDVAFFQRYTRKKTIEDHGYNGTPFHAFIASNLAKIIPVNYQSMVAIGFMDIVAICVMFALVTWAFGWKSAALMAIFYFTNFADRYTYNGASYIRFIWMACLGSGVAFLKKEKYAPAAILMAASAMLNVFPLLFVSGIGVKVVVQAVKERRLSPAYRTFIVWGIAAALSFGSISLFQARGVDNYKEFFGNMGGHSSLLTVSRIGFLYNFIYYGEVTKNDTRVSYSYKRKQLARKALLINVVTGIILLFGFVAIARLDDVSATALGGFLLFFMLFSTVEYYYAVSAMLVLVFHKGIEEDRGPPRLLLSLLFAGMSGVYLLWKLTRHLKFCNNHAMSFLFTVYIAALLYFLGKELGLFRDILLLEKSSLVQKIKNSSFYKQTASSFTTIIALCTKHWKWLVSGAILLSFLAGAAHYFLTKSEPGKYTLFATGDTILARRMHYHVNKHGSAWPSRDVAPIMRKADIAMTNLETVIAVDGQMYAKNSKNPFYFRGRPELSDVLYAAGVDFVTTANNHGMDYGSKAMREQQKILTEAHIAWAGSGENLQEAARPAFIKVDNVVVAFISMYIGGGDTAASKDKPGVFQVRNNRQVIKALRPHYLYARKHADIVVFSPHWGVNLTKNPTPSRVSLAHKLIDMGFDGILGHSAHQLHGIEVYKGKPIIYDMGNFIADWVSSKRMASGAGFQLRFNKHGFTELEVIPLKLGFGYARLAQNSDNERVQKIIIEQSKRLNRFVSIRNRSGRLYLQLKPSKRKRKTVKESLYHLRGQTKKLPHTYTQSLGSYVTKNAPSYCSGFSVIPFEHSVELLGVKTVEAVNRGSGFLLEVAFKVTKPLEGSWEAVVFVENSEGSVKYHYKHPISNGAVPTWALSPGNIIIDRTCVRSKKKLSDGDYVVRWALHNRDTNKWIYAVGADGKKVAPEIATISILQNARSTRVSGIDWDGKR